VSDHPANQINELKKATATYGSPVIEAVDGVDIDLLRTSLAMTPWERMRANDDALNFAESLRAGMEKRNAQSQ
jgi:hypothetical protein